MTWRNERCVELPIVFSFLERRGKGLGMEFGNVTSQYGRLEKLEVVDKYDSAPGVINIDILSYHAPEPLDFIISVSTIEHVGWDERPRVAGKAVAAFEHLRSLLSPSGRMLVTAPLGHNDDLDAAVMGGQLAVQRQLTLVREGDAWRQTPTLEWRPYPGISGSGADSVWIAEATRQA